MYTCFVSGQAKPSQCLKGNTLFFHWKHWGQWVNWTSWKWNGASVFIITKLCWPYLRWQEKIGLIWFWTTDSMPQRMGPWCLRVPTLTMLEITSVTLLIKMATFRSMSSTYMFSLTISVEFSLHLKSDPSIIEFCMFFSVYCIVKWLIVFFAFLHKGEDTLEKDNTSSKSCPSPLKNSMPWCLVISISKH